MIVQVDMEKLAGSLPMHLASVLISSNRDEAMFKYVLCGVRLLHALCDLSSRNSKFEQVCTFNAYEHLSHSASVVVVFCFSLHGKDVTRMLKNDIYQIFSKV